MEQMLNIMRKHNNLFLPARAAFNKKPNNLTNTNHVVTDSSDTQCKSRKE